MMNSLTRYARIPLSLIVPSAMQCPCLAIELPKDSKLKSFVEEYLPSDYAPGEDPLATPEMKPRSTESVRLGWKYFNAKDFDTALRRFFMGIRMDPANASAYFGVAYTCSVQNNYDDAIVFYREALKHEKKYSPIYANLALALLLKDLKSTEVAPLLQEALRVDPNNADACATYSLYCAVNGQWELGEQMSKKAQSLGKEIEPKILAALKTKTRIQSLK